MDLQYAIDRDQLAEIIALAEVDPAHLHLNYRGRGMFGCTCLAVTGSVTDLALFLLAAGRVLDHDHAVELFGWPRQDSLGFGMITYWPRVTVSGEGVGRDGQWVDGSPDPLNVLM